MRYLVRSFGLLLICFQPLLAQETGNRIPSNLAGHTRRWHLPEGAIARLAKGSIAPGDHAVDLSSDGKYLAVASDIGVWIYEVATNRVVTLWPAEARVRSVSFSPVGTTLAAGLARSTIGLWQTTTGKRIGTLHGESMYSSVVVFSPDGATLASGANNGTVHLWDMATRTAVAVLEGHTERVEALVFSPDGNTLASSGDENIKLWDVAAREEFATLEGHRDGVSTLAFSPDGATLASGSEDGTARFWDVTGKEQIATLYVDRTGVSAVAFSPDGSTLTTGSSRLITHWDVAARRSPRHPERAQFPGPIAEVFIGRKPLCLLVLRWIDTIA